jgi:D-tyrosyl-tRNA(Tyr) deacylase
VLALVQRVRRAKVTVADEVVGAIGRGFLLLVCAEQGDTVTEADKLLAKVLKLRVFSDAEGKMNLSLLDLEAHGTQGGLLIVSQFTLAADTSGGNRPSFKGAAAPDEGRRLYEHFVARALLQHPQVATGIFAADMQVELVNDGPVTIPMRVAPMPADPH